MREIFIRRSIRKFDLAKEISKEDMLKLVNAGFCAPSARNQQPANFVIIDDLEIINELAGVSRGAQILLNCNRAIAVIGDYNESAPALKMVPTDLAAATENILLMATSLNIGSCWIGIYPEEERMKEMANILNLPKDKIPFSIIALGYLNNENQFKEIDRFNSSKVFYNKL